MPYGHLIAATVMTLGVCQGDSSIASFFLYYKHVMQSLSHSIASVNYQFSVSLSRSDLKISCNKVNNNSEKNLDFIVLAYRYTANIVFLTKLLRQRCTHDFPTYMRWSIEVTLTIFAARTADRLVELHLHLTDTQNCHH